jgi:ribonuclease BN (tRNA processing enzyme)
MQVKLIGTGSGKTQLSRFHTALLVSESDKNLLIDTGDGISKALLKLDINYNLIDYIFVTHTHADHFAGLPSLITQMKISGRTNPLKLYVHKSLLEFFDELLAHAYLFRETLDFELQIIGYSFGNNIRLENNFSFIPVQNYHITNKQNIKRIDAAKFVSSSVFVSGKGTSFYYTSDISGLSDLELSTKFRPKYIFSEVTHIPFDEIVNSLKNAEVEKCFLVHINDEEELSEKYKTAPDIIKEKIKLTYDGMDINLS